MKQKIIDGLYIFIMIAVFVLAVYSLLSPQETSVIENMALVIFATIISIAMLCCILFDKEDKEK